MALRLGRLDAVIFSAGMVAARGHPETPVEQLDHLHAVNVRAPFCLLRRASEVMRRSASAGTMINVLGLPADARSEGTMATPPSTVRVTLRADRAPDLPAELDGARVVISVPGAVVTHYTVGSDRLIAAEAGELLGGGDGRRGGDEGVAAARGTSGGAARRGGAATGEADDDREVGQHCDGLTPPEAAGQHVGGAAYVPRS